MIQGIYMLNLSTKRNYYKNDNKTFTNIQQKNNNILTKKTAERKNLLSLMTELLHGYGFRRVFQKKVLMTLAAAIVFEVSHIHAD